MASAGSQPGKEYQAEGFGQKRQDRKIDTLNQLSNIPKMPEISIPKDFQDKLKNMEKQATKKFTPMA